MPGRGQQERMIGHPRSEIGRLESHGSECPAIVAVAKQVKVRREERGVTAEPTGLARPACESGAEPLWTLAHSAALDWLFGRGGPITAGLGAIFRRGGKTGRFLEAPGAFSPHQWMLDSSLFSSALFPLLSLSLSF
ncbi:hypothetical protein CDAR_460211 [Caerostris darwini]|uniref:Uncharacterized protein n=1 Tax=Caerostris darwini TaxID=1538125 RepID=A0AAV4RB17_9ARAC|nr:hypothetical protein CDAR_460211 [Caerostris darwini]